MAFERFKQLPTGRKVLLVVLAVLIILLILVTIYLLLRQPPQQPNVVAPPPQPAEEKSIQIERRIDAGVVADIVGANGNGEAPTVASMEVDATIRAISFVERFGSYSNQGGFENFVGLNEFMTDNFSSWVDGYRKGLEEKYSDFNTYYGIDTKAISTETLSSDETNGTAQMLVKTQRQEFLNTLNTPRIFFQDIRLELVMKNNDWKVDGAYWLE